ALIFVGAGCSGTGAAPGTGGPAGSGPAVHDVHSFARPAEARVTHVALDLTADFAAHRLSGTATLTVQRSPDATEVVLDTRDLDVQSVTTPEGEALEFTLSAPDSTLGRALTVSLPEAGDRIVVHYSTS